MPLENLQAQITPGQHIAIEGKTLRVLDKDGVVLVQYTMDVFGCFWPSFSKPPKGCCRITNLYWDPNISQVVVEIDNTPA